MSQQDDRISHFINAQGIEDDKKIIIDTLNAIKDKIQEVDKIKLSLFGTNTISQVIAAIKALNVETNKLHAEEKKALELSILNEKQRLAAARATLEEAKAAEKLYQAQQKRNKASSSGSKGGGGGDTEASPFQLLKNQAKEAKDEFNSLFILQQRGLGITQNEVDAAKSKWKSYEAQLREVGRANKAAFDPELAQKTAQTINFLEGQISQLEASLSSVKAQMRSLASTPGGSKSSQFKSLSDDADIYSGKLRLLRAELKKLSATEQERQAIQSESGKTAASIEKEIQAGQKVNSIYQALQQQLRELQAIGQELAAKGLLGPLSDLEKQKLADIQVEASKLANELAKIDNQLGKGAKNNYAYTQQLFSLQQVLRETPNIAFGWNIFLASLSNNIPILADDLKRLKDRNVELAAAGRPTTSVLSQIGKALFSWTSAIAIGVAIITIFGERIAKWVGDLFRSEAAIRKNWLASQQYLDIQKQLTDVIGKLYDSQKRLNDIAAKGNDAAVRGVKSQISELEALGVSLDKTFRLKEKLNNLEEDNAKKRDDSVVGNLRNNIERETNSSIADTEAKKKIAQDRLNKLLSSRARIIEKQGASGANEFERFSGKEVKALKDQILEFDKTIAAQRIKQDEQLTNTELASEELKKRRRMENNKIIFEQELKFNELQFKISQDLQDKANGKDGLSKKALKKLETQAAISQNLISNAQKENDEIDKTDQQLADADAERKRLAAEQTAFYSEQGRRIRLSNAKYAAESEISIQEDLLDNDRKSFKEKLLAIDKLADKKKDVARAERSFAVSALGATGADIVEAENDFSQTMKDIDIQTARDRQQILDDYLEARLDASKTELESEKNLSIRYNNDITEGFLAELTQRTDALNKSFLARKELIDQAFRSELLLAGLSEKEAEDFAKGGSVDAKNKKLELEQLLALRVKYNADLKNLGIDAAESNVDILINELARQKNIIEQNADKISTSLSENNVGRDKSMLEETEALENQYKKRLLTAKEFADAYLKLTRNNESQRLKELGDSLDKELLDYKDALANKIAAEDNYTRAKEKLRNAVGEEQIKTAKDEVKVAEAGYLQALEFYNKLIELIDKLNGKKRDEAQKARDEKVQELEAEQQIWSLRFEMYGNMLNFAQSIEQTLFDNKMKKLDEEMAKLDEKANKERAIIEQSVLNEEDKQRRLASLDLKTANQKEILEAKRRKTERDAAIAQKAFSIFRVLLEQAATLVNIQFQISKYAAALNPIGVAAATAQIPFTIANAALAIGTIAAQPLPKLARGTPDFPGGAAILGDGGRRELVMNPDGSMYVTGDKPELRYLQKHAVVLPDADAAISAAMSVADGVIGMTGPAINPLGFGELNTTMKNGFTILATTIRNKPELILRRGMNADLLMRYGVDYWKYIN